MAGDAPGGLSAEEFKSIALDVGDWVWGTVQGAFNEKATTSQILVDAVIGMVPFVGDVTGVRDLIAVVIGLATAPPQARRDDAVDLVGDPTAGADSRRGRHHQGRRAPGAQDHGEVAHVAAGAQRAAHMAQAAKDIVAFLNRVGVGNAEKFLTELKFADHQAALLDTLNELIDTVSSVLKSAKERVGIWVPARFTEATDALLAGLKWLKEAAPQRLKDAIKQLDDHLRELQRYVRSGGETTSQTFTHTIDAASKPISRTDELILLEGKASTRSARGGLAPNSSLSVDLDLVYRHEPGFPDLRAGVDELDDGSLLFPDVATYSGKIINRELQPGERVFRVFGPGGTTHGVPVGTSYASGRPGGNSFWGLNEVPDNAESWRQGSAVLDEWNHNGFIIVGTVQPGHTLPACTGLIAEQAGAKIGAQYLRGGSKQAMLKLPADVAKELGELGAKVQATGSELVERGGVRWELRATGWSDVNEIHGYVQSPGPGSVKAERLGAQTIATKIEED